MKKNRSSSIVDAGNNDQKHGFATHDIAQQSHLPTSEFNHKIASTIKCYIQIAKNQVKLEQQTRAGRKTEKVLQFKIISRFLGVYLRCIYQYKTKIPVSSTANFGGH